MGKMLEDILQKYCLRLAKTNLMWVLLKIRLNIIQFSMFV